ncbi:hypothetical protein Hypma_014349 [Hypsizygus marmoreus]|uniref:Uncharacterized protein n=1 Tax=Hypsizygus marmoreus TaxID=39966 RepID=A0A369JAC7_HYPMA|nr:hypothetical protein Hypma_014349 [Hypsizygus marmoreus]
MQCQGSSIRGLAQHILSKPKKLRSNQASPCPVRKPIHREKGDSCCTDLRDACSQLGNEEDSEFWADFDFEMVPRRLFGNSNVKSWTSMIDTVSLRGTTKSWPPPGSGVLFRYGRFSFLFKPNETLIDDIQPYLTLEDKNENTFAAEASSRHDRDQVEALSDVAPTENKSICAQLAAELKLGLEE